MKRFSLVLFTTTFAAFQLLSQNVEIPDNLFLDALIDEGVDTNGDGLISFAEAEKINTINIYNIGRIIDLTGIEAFSNLDTLYCGRNRITTLNLSSNAKLKYLDCHDQTEDSILRFRLNVSGCIALKYLNCSNNKLTSLNVSNNSVLEHMDLTAMPSLHKVCVWTFPFPETVEVDTTGSPNVYFTTECSYDSIVFIPDPCFLNALMRNNCDTDGDFQISYDEAKECKELGMRGRNISDITGIEAFVNLTELDCFNNNLTNLNFTNNSSLERLSCSENALTNLNISNCPALTDLNCRDNQLSSLDVSNNTALKYFDCSSNHLTSLDVSNCPALINLYCSGNQLSSLDVSNNTALKNFNCSSNHLTSLDISYNQKLYKLDISVMPELKNLCVWTLPFPPSGLELNLSYSPNIVYSIDCGSNYLIIPDTSFLHALLENGVDANGDSSISKTEALTVNYLDVSNFGISDLTRIEAFVNLDSLNCSNNRITNLNFPSNKLITLDVSNNDSLETLNCQSNLLTSLDVSNCSALTHLYCNNNQLTNLNIANCSSLTHLYCDVNQLTYLNVAHCKALAYLNCGENKLSTLQLTTNTFLIELHCGKNQINSIDLSNSPVLYRLNVSENQLSQLDISKNDSIQYCSCNNNQLTLLDVSNNLNLKELDCSYNQIETLDISNNDALGILACGGNKLKVLDVSNLYYYDCFWWCMGVVHVNDMPTLNQINLGNSFYPEKGWGPEIYFKHIEEDYYLHIDTTGSPNINFIGTVVYIPDTAFLYTLIDNGVDADGDSLISYEEAEMTNSIKTDGGVYNPSPITNLTGIEAFINIDTIIIINQGFDKLNLSNNPSLKYLDIRGCGLSNINLSNCTELTYLDCGHAYGWADLVGATNQLGNLDISNHTKLEYLNCSFNTFKNLDYSNHPSLKELICIGNELDTLDVSNCTKLTYIDCDEFEVWGPTIKNLNATGCSSLKSLECSGVHLTNLNVSNCTELTHLYCGAAYWGWFPVVKNHLTALNISDNSKLKELFCDFNQLTKLNITNNVDLERLNCGYNLLKNLDVTKNLALTHLYCSRNLFDSLDICNNTEIGTSDVSYPWESFHLKLDSMPTLNQVCVWEGFRTDSISIDTTGSPNVYFTTECSASSGIEDNNLKGFSIFPNPTNTQLIIETGIHELYNIEIISLNGQLVYSTMSEGSTIQLDLSAFQKGVYFVTVRSRDFVRTEKIIKL